MEKKKEQLKDIMTIGLFYLMLLGSVYLVANVNYRSVDDSLHTIPQYDSKC